jgi:putative protease
LYILGVKMVELLSPARNFAALNSAVKNGANSVYIGIEGCNMRAHAANFKIEDLKMAADICHEDDVKLYICTNTIMNEDEIEHLNGVMPVIRDSGADAVIVSDLGALKVAREHGVPVHMSVQANLSNTESLQLLEELGVERAILSRELSLDDIKRIRSGTGMEIETFVHGAMCMAVSGRCFLSSHLYNKSANCGECIQPCRKRWKLLSEDGEELSMEVSEGSVPDTTSILSPRDLCMVGHVPELVESGIDAFKIEGRARPADYVATVTKVYREAIDTYNSGSWNINRDERMDGWMSELRKVFNRGFDTGFYLRKPYKISGYNESTHKKQDIGEVVNYYNRVSAAEIRLWNDLEVDDEVVIQGPTTGSLIQKVQSMQINGENIQKGFKGQNVAISVVDKVRANDSVYKRIKK